MMFASALKAAILQGADFMSAVVGGPQNFTRAKQVDPLEAFPDDMARRDAIAASAEKELAGFVFDGVFASSKRNDMGDAAIWQGVYTAMTVMRWRVKPTPENQAAMQAAALALSRFFYPTGPGVSILVRGAAPITLEHDFFEIDPTQGAHYFTDGYLGPVYAYRDDASLDSMLGAMFGAAFVRRFGDAASYAVLTLPLERFARGFAAAGCRLTRRDGQPTTYGDCAPGFLQAPVRNLAAALPSLVAEGGTPGAVWRDVAGAYAPEFATPDTQLPGRISWVNAHLAILATLTYVCASQPGDPGRAEACAGVRSLLDKYSDSGNAFLVYAAAFLGLMPTRVSKDKADKVMIEFPVGPKPKAGLNSSLAPALQPVPVWQRPPVDVIWQRSPYTYSGADAKAYNRLDYLLAHYFDRSTCP